jgi:hypothetical protein
MAHAIDRTHANAHARYREFLLCWGIKTLPHAAELRTIAGDFADASLGAYARGKRAVQVASW